MHIIKPIRNGVSIAILSTIKRDVPRLIPGRAVATSTQESKKPQEPAKDNDPTLSEALGEKAKQAPKKLTTVELDEQLRHKMAGLSGDGGEAGVEFEDGKPVAMKRSVKNNMFRYI